MSEVKVTMPSSTNTTGTSNNEVPMLCAGLIQLEKNLKLYVDSTTGSGGSATLPDLTENDAKALVTEVFPTVHL